MILPTLAQYVLWRIEMRPTKSGDMKPTKVPLNARTGERADPTNPADWCTYDEAIASPVPREGIGFCFTAEDPYFFLDIDHAFKEGVWSDVAVQLMQAFQGCYLEMSYSGDGAHIIGRGEHPDHGKRNNTYGIELYTADRFCALTCNGSGSVETVTENLPWLIHSYFPPPPPVDLADWTDGPCEGWFGSDDDEQLIRAMLKSQSTRQIFGASCPIRVLWDATDMDTLSAHFPDTGRDYDESAADAALCAHLAFWTGKDCERMDRLYRVSGLMREKWEARPDYRHRTIMGAVAQCTSVWQSPELQRMSAAVDWQTQAAPQAILHPEAVPGVLTGPRMVGFEDRGQFFTNHVFLTGRAEVYCPDGLIRKKESYNAMYGNYEFIKPFGAKGLEKSAWDAYIMSPQIQRAEARDTAYRPELPQHQVFQDGNSLWVNEYEPADGARMAGDPSVFVNHVRTILPSGEDADILLAWMAALVQYPGRKFLWAPLIQGAEGNGKSLLGRVLTYVIGEPHVQDIDPEEFLNGNSFNKWVKTTRLALIEELKTDNYNRAEALLKRSISQKRIQYQPKGVDQTTISVCVNYLITTNHQDAVPLKDDSRRYAPLFCAQQTDADLQAVGMHRDGRYFQQLFDWFDNHNGWAICADYLHTVAIPDHLNPATAADKAPLTSSSHRAVAASRTAGEDAVIEALATNTKGTLGDWANKTVVHRIVEGMSPKMVGKCLERLGYVRHPALPEGRSTRLIAAEGGARPVLYVRAGSAAAHLTDAAMASLRYERDQGYEVVGVGEGDSAAG